MARSRSVRDTIGATGCGGGSRGDAGQGPANGRQMVSRGRRRGGEVRNVWSNIGGWNLYGWLYRLVELASWDHPAEQLVDRTDRPWDNPDRRPSHADRRRQITRKMLRNEFLKELPADLDRAEIQTRLARLLDLAT